MKTPSFLFLQLTLTFFLAFAHYNLNRAVGPLPDAPDSVDLQAAASSGEPEPETTGTPSTVLPAAEGSGQQVQVRGGPESVGSSAATTRWTATANGSEGSDATQ
ncbi:hypothetical protein E3N88_08248 [Mikania micrantha]|uniref:Uncharacterized protein n=1 Tax=Mikania micrantha TaxID=192012 RepID=A0A5N6PHY1_9ASTR|nr:hypothetical protein E3N88_08248 [Mikania micrantha]